MKQYPFPEQTLGHILEDKARAHEERCFLEFEDGSSMTYAQCNQITSQMAAGLYQIGLRKGDSIASLIPNSLDSITLWFGAAKAGIIEVPINLANKGHFLSHILNNSRCKVIVIDVELIDRLKAIETEIDQLETVVVWSKTGDYPALPQFNARVIEYDQLLNNGPQTNAIDIRSNDPQMVIYTSGTTGPSKGVLDCHSMIYLSAAEYIEAMRATEDDILFTFLPLFHANARILCIYPAMLLGTKVVIYERFSASRFWSQVKKHKATMFNSLGAIAQFIYNQPRTTEDGDNPIRVCAAYPMPPEIYDDFENRYNLKVVEGYGLTELAIITYNPWDRPKIGSCGKATNSFEIQIVDDDDWPVPAGTVGEIVARGTVPWATAMEYQNMPEKTVELMRNHFYHTGDAGYLDEDGYLFFQDRIKDYIRRRGENISSAEIEKVVNSHPQVSESAAISVKSEVSEDEVMVVVVPQPGQTVEPLELIKHCESRMPYFAVPRFVDFRESLPKTSNEKVQKAKLRESGVTDTTWDREKAGYQIKR
ncbi:AMP-dependent synthetase and ligase [Desulfosarcina variabilis str. Montpellier]|uniref:ATP-dependent acyl-CoA ligase n=1 Tax=Desulfosarcina variabilis TaxID=2300 RepID=UPI003AFAD197